MVRGLCDICRYNVGGYCTRRHRPIEGRVLECADYRPKHPVHLLFRLMMLLER